MNARALRLIVAAAAVAAIAGGAYFLMERSRRAEPPEARTAPAVETTAISPEALREARQKARAAAKEAVGEGCTQLSADYEVWEDYLDKKTRKKLKALIAKCDQAGEAQVSVEP